MGKKKLVFATNNKNKLAEIAEQIGDRFEVLSLKDISLEKEIPEDHDTLEANAFQKAETIFSETGLNVFADDTGLMVDALNGEPGVYSARYAGEKANADENMDKLLGALVGAENRNAHFKTVIALILDGKKFSFEGQCNGEILKERTGADGFGYDPIFKPEESELSFAEMNMSEKAMYSHRGKAVRKLISFLKDC